MLAARDACIAELLYGCGLRVGELVGLDVAASGSAAGWIDAARRQRPRPRQGQQAAQRAGRQPALQAAGGVAGAARRAWRGRARRRSSSAAAAPASRASQVRSRLKAQALAAGLPTHVHPHMLRHSFASHVLQSSGDLRAVQELLGHANITTTQVYTKLDFGHLSKVYDAAHPRAEEARRAGALSEDRSASAPGKERSLLRRHPWVFEGSVAGGRADAGETVRVEGERRALPRLGGVQPAVVDPPARLELRRSASASTPRSSPAASPRAVAIRARLPIASDGVRLVHGEADGLPGPGRRPLRRHCSRRSSSPPAPSAGRRRSPTRC